MCGIIGIITKRPNNGFIHKEVELFRHLLLLDTMRGWDSTGVFGVNCEGDIDIAKDITTGSEFAKTQDFKDISTKMVRNGFALIGHNRAATRGVVADKNAHPFWYEDKVVLVHNGTFVGDHRKHVDVDVDSEALAHMLGQHEVTEVEDVFNKITAAYACVWYDTRDNSLNIIRNSERPLFFYDAGRSWYISSEKSILAFAMSRCDIKFEHDQIHLLTENDHVKIVQKNNETTLTNNHLKLGKDKDIETKFRRYVSEEKKEQQEPETPQVSGPSLLLENDSNVAKLEVKLDAVREAIAANEKAVAVIDSFRLNQTQEKRHSRDANIIDDDLGDSRKLVPFSEYEKCREYYPNGSSVSFVPRGVVQASGGEVVLYGLIDESEGIYAAVNMTEEKFEQLLNTCGKDNKVKMKSVCPVYLNKKATLDVRTFEGLCVLYGEHPENTTTKEENAVC